MKNELLIIIKKEFKRFFGDKRLFFSTVLLPGIIIYVMYSFLGNMIQDNLAPDEEHEPIVYMCNAPESAQTMFEAMKITYKDVSADKVEGIKQKIGDKKADALLVFPDKFDEQVVAYDAIASAQAAPEIAIYYNSAETESQAVYEMLVQAYDAYETTMSNKFDINREADVKYDLASEADTTAQVFSMMVPKRLTKIR